MTDWDADGERLTQNLGTALRLCRDAAMARDLPDANMAMIWHREIMAGLDVPDASYVGAFRGSPGLELCEVAIGRHRGTPALEVAEALADFGQNLKDAVRVLDAIIPAGELPADRDQLNAVIELCAWTHAEWVRIHPFANGNGRTARLWAGFVAMRYGLPLFVPLRPRPPAGYGKACEQAMKGDWSPTATIFRDLYLAAVRRG